MNFVLLFDSIYLITVVSHRKALDLNWHRLSSYHYKTRWLSTWASDPRATHICAWKWRQIWVTPRLYVLVNSYKDFFLRLFSYEESIFFIPYFYFFIFHKIPSNDLNSDYSNILTIQIDFCFVKSYFSLLIRT